MKKDSMKYVGCDLGDRYSTMCVLDSEGQVLERGRVQTTPEAMRGYFEELGPSEVTFEVGGHSRWMDRVVKEAGHRSYVANAHTVKLIWGRHDKTDAKDAEKLARLLRVDPKLLDPVQHRSEELHAVYLRLSVRWLLVRARAQMVNAVRGMVKSAGGRVPRCDVAVFADRAGAVVAEPQRKVLSPLLQMIDALTGQIREVDRELATIAEAMPQVGRLRQVPGVGVLVALTFVCLIADPQRFSSSRKVGAYVGLCPKLDQSSQRDRQLPISKHGNDEMRRLLVQSAQYILGPFGPDSDLRRWGQALMERGKKNAKKRAIVAVARKLAVLLHRLWVSGEAYVPVGYRRPQRTTDQGPQAPSKPRRKARPRRTGPKAERCQGAAT